MSTLFTRILDGDIPGRFVWEDDVCAAFLTIEPLQPGHTLVVPRAEVDHWPDLPEEIWSHLLTVARHIGAAQRSAFSPQRIGLLIQGYEIPHTHVHVWPSQSSADFDLAAAAHDVPGAELDEAAEALRQALRAAGLGTHVPG
ncbi:HIT family protein [Ruania alba]|uniref:Histidine triad (HIT) family protein n=1 Tax=Ruania alba TaxID=648782 RepID=A0A1H5FMY5_9MICO|nr:HIT family protein [Ruania alba]SEE04524.1 histidine triad (HIT) family protein [Ruania alba]